MMKQFADLYQEIHDYISTLWVVDSHEHTANYKSWPTMDYIQLTVNTYSVYDLRSAGLPAETLKKITNPALPVMERWLMLEPYWQACRNTGFVRMHERIARDVYGVDGINRNTIEQLTRLLASTDHRKSYYEGLERAKVLCCITDSDMDCNRDYCRPAFRMEEFVEKIRVAEVRQRMNTHIYTFIDWLNACEETVRRYVEGGAVAFKSTIATDRTLDIGYGSYAEAEASFLDAIREDNGYQTVSKAYQDFMFRFVLSQVRKYGLPTQMHTGFAASNANLIRNGNPSLLCPLFCEYRDMNFVMMHMGYPYQRELGAIGKMFPNVYADMSWAHIISPIGARQVLSDWLDEMPATKILAFGADCGHENFVIGHLLMARDHISHVLAQKVVDGCFDLEHAKWVGKQILQMNGYRVFNLEKAGVVLK